MCPQPSPLRRAHLCCTSLWAWVSGGAYIPRDATPSPPRTRCGHTARCASAPRPARRWRCNAASPPPTTWRRHRRGKDIDTSAHVIRSIPEMRRESATRSQMTLVSDVVICLLETSRLSGGVRQEICTALCLSCWHDFLSLLYLVSPSR